MDISKGKYDLVQNNSFEISVMHQVPENTNLPIPADFGIIQQVVKTDY
jgi:hypothetical protein